MSHAAANLSRSVFSRLYTQKFLPCSSLCTRTVTWRPISGAINGQRISTAAGDDDKLFRDLSSRLAEDKEFSRRLAKEMAERCPDDLTAVLDVKNGTGVDGTAGMEPITRTQYIKQSIRAGVPFMVFGLSDNFFMITAGGALDNTLGTTIGLTTMAAAGLGNFFSDIVGTSCSGIIQSFADKLRLPNPGLSPKQLHHHSIHVVNYVASIVGIAVGCLLGMFPLLLS